jgi:hypothetical protein
VAVVACLSRLTSNISLSAVAAAAVVVIILLTAMSYGAVLVAAAVQAVCVMRLVLL